RARSSRAVVALGTERRSPPTLRINPHERKRGSRGYGACPTGPAFACSPAELHTFSTGRARDSEWNDQDTAARGTDGGMIARPAQGRARRCGRGPERGALGARPADEQVDAPRDR